MGQVKKKKSDSAAKKSRRKYKKLEEEKAAAAAENSTTPDPIDGEGTSAHHAQAVDHVSELHDTRDKST